MNAFTKTLQILLLLEENRAKGKGEPAVLEAVALPPVASRGKESRLWLEASS